jgi:hypothetical protein
MAANIPGRIIRGSNGRIDWGGGFYATLGKYTVDIKAQKISQLSFESFNDLQVTGLPAGLVVAGTGALFDDGDSGTLTCSISASGYYDKNNNPFGTPPSLAVGVYVGPGVTFNSGSNTVTINTNPIKIWVDKTSSSKYFLYSLLQIMDCKVDADVDNKRVEFSVSLEARGPWAYPGSS